MEDTPVPPLFELDLGENGGLLAPTSLAELREWLDREWSFYSWLQPDKPQGSFRTAVDQARTFLQRAKANADSVPDSDLDSANSRAILGQALANIEQAFIARALPHSSTATAARIDQLRDDPIEAFSYLYVFVKNDENPFDGRDVSSWKGFLRGMQERFGLASDEDRRVLAYAASLNSLAGRYDSELVARANELKQLQARTTTEFDSLAKSATDQSEEAARLRSDESAAFNAAQASHLERMQAIEDSFKEKMGLRAPAKYWQDRKARHGTWSIIYSILAVIAFALAIAGGWEVAKWIASGIDPATNKPEYWRLVVAGFFAVIGVWVIRLLVKMLLSHIHLGTDATERKTLIETYLSLIEAGAAFKDEDRQVILAAIFRRGSDGLVKDDALPNPLLDIITRSK
jgi:hypothetical protein